MRHILFVVVLSLSIVLSNCPHCLAASNSLSSVVSFSEHATFLAAEERVAIRCPFACLAQESSTMDGKSQKGADCLLRKAFIELSQVVKEACLGPKTKPPDVSDGSTTGYRCLFRLSPLLLAFDRPLFSAVSHLSSHSFNQFLMLFNR